MAKPAARAVEGKPKKSKAAPAAASAPAKSEKRPVTVVKKTKPAKTAAAAPAAKAAPAPAKSPKGLGNYQNALKFVLDRVNVERMHARRVDPSVFKLDRMAAIMKHLGDPQDSLKCVHIGGTNGKGSTVAMVASCLRACGYTVGTYTSPHLVDIRERIAINGTMISHHHFTDLAGKVGEAIEHIPKKLGDVTFFEVMTAMGFLHFAEQAVDAAVIEVGLGGKLDSTNIITPEVAAVAAIGFDHMQFLGNTLTEIARQKAGIFKPGVPALTIQQEAGVVDAMRDVAQSTGAIFEVVGADIDFSYRFEANPQLGPHTRVGLSTDRYEFEHVPVPLPGEHQAHNCGLALAIVDKLAQRGFELPENKVIRGLEETRIPGRMELVIKEPRILLDGAHNPQALGALMKSIGAHVPYDSMIMIFGCAADKDLDEILKKVALGGDKVIFTKAKGNARAAEPAELHRRFQEFSGKMSQTAETLEEALNIAGRAAGREDMICITGSFYLVGEAKKLLADRMAKANVPVATA